MALRLIEVVLPEREADTLEEILQLDPRGGPWRHAADRGLLCTRFVLDADNAGEIVDEVQRRYCNVPGFHLLIQPVTAALLLAVNVICVNLAATATFLVQGIRPRTWWQADRARRASVIALVTGAALVIALAFLIWVAQT